MTELENRIAEVVESSTVAFTAQCYELYQLPPLGGMVKTRDSATELYAFVYNATTSSFETGRRPIARGKDETSEEAIYQSNPQLTKLLRSEFQALVVGHRQGEQVYQYLAPRPARIHSFVYVCPPQEVRQFSQSFDFLNLLINTRLQIPVDELIAACLRQMADVQQDRHAFLVSAGKELATLLSGNFNQLKAILWRIK